MTRPAPLPAELGDHFSVSAARDLGVGRSRTRRRDLIAPFHGVRSRIGLDTPRDYAAAYLARLPETGFFSHTTAAAIWGLPLPRGVDPRLHVSYPNGHRPTRVGGVAGHHLVIRADEVTVLDGIPITTPERTWCDLAGLIGFEDLVAAGDRVIWRTDRLASIEAVHDMARRHPDRRHRRRRDVALPWLCDRSDSPPETLLRVRFVRAGLPEPVVNEDLFDRDGAFLGRPDLAYPEYRELVDYEGDGHRTDRQQWFRDLARVPRFEDADWHTTRAATPDLADGSRPLIRRLARRLHDKGWTGSLTF
jgi:hypothetical protein